MNRPRGRKMSLSRLIVFAAALVVSLLCALHYAALAPAAARPRPVASAPAEATVQASPRPAPVVVRPPPPERDVRIDEREAAPAAARAAVSAMPAKVASSKHATEEVHIIFSTDCSGYQHWQSIALWYSSRQAGQHGAVTRIASGCDDEKRKTIPKEWAEIDETGFFRVHFAPKGELKGNYKYSNKPSGLWHWLNHASPAPFVDPSVGIVVLLDPDQMLLRPIGGALAAGLSARADDVKALYDDAGQPRILLDAGPKALAALPQRVSPGFPAAQEYGIGGPWAIAGSPNARPSWRTFDRSQVCGTGPCTRTEMVDADNHYSVGPPYVLHHTDARLIAEAWLRAMPGVHSQYPHLLAEMYAYSMAAANLTLPHAQLHHYMVSNVGVGAGEAWSWVDGYDTCAGADLTTPPDATRPDAAVFSAALDTDAHAPGPAVPSVLHFCQSYRAGGVKFGKHSMPHDFFSCDGGLLHFDVAAIAGASIQGKSSSQTRRAAFFLCNVIPRLNRALLEYKRTVCPKRGLATWNEEPSIDA
ncbi:hypothetical protein M885DRAFT_508486 [Pelagophyceae sp. CCMP2097]|nr:hypothetical protein M885DRAFT_508486 [Pelagophyceae sp. CCMP2097]